MKDYRLPFADNVIKYLREKINTEVFGIKYYSSSIEDECNFLKIIIQHEKIPSLSFVYIYDPSQYEIRETNKKMKRKDKTLEEIVARECYDQFMAWWIGQAKKPKENKEIEDGDSKD